MQARMISDNKLTKTTPYVQKNTDATHYYAIKVVVSVHGHD
jgi:hypothetical protein